VHFAAGASVAGQLLVWLNPIPEAVTRPCRYW
jgi:hypothetical protein